MALGSCANGAGGCSPWRRCVKPWGLIGGGGDPSHCALPRFGGSLVLAPLSARRSNRRPVAHGPCACGAPRCSRGLASRTPAALRLCAYGASRNSRRLADCTPVALGSCANGAGGCSPWRRCVKPWGLIGGGGNPSHCALPRFGGSLVLAPLSARRSNRRPVAHGPCACGAPRCSRGLASRTPAALRLCAYGASRNSRRLADCTPVALGSCANGAGGCSPWRRCVKPWGLIGGGGNPSHCALPRFGGSLVLAPLSARRSNRRPVAHGPCACGAPRCSRGLASRTPAALRLCAYGASRNSRRLADCTPVALGSCANGAGGCSPWRRCVKPWGLIGGGGDPSHCALPRFGGSLVLAPLSARRSNRRPVAHGPCACGAPRCSRGLASRTPAALRLCAYGASRNSRRLADCTPVALGSCANGAGGCSPGLCWADPSGADCWWGRRPAV